MSFIVLILAFAGTLVASCAPKGNIGDYIPQWAGGPPKNLPPRPGTPEYDEFKRRLDAEAAAQGPLERSQLLAQYGLRGKSKWVSDLRGDWPKRNAAQLHEIF